MMKKITIILLLVLVSSLVACQDSNTGLTTTQNGSSTSQSTSVPSSASTESSSSILDLPFLQPLDLSQDMIDEFAFLMNDQMLYLSNDVMIHRWVEDPDGFVFSGDSYIRVYDGTSRDFSIGRSSLEYFMGYDEANNVVYYNSQDTVKHSGDFTEQNEIKFYGDLKYLSPDIFAYGNGFYDYFGNNLTEGVDGTKVVYKYAMGEELIYHDYNYKETSDDACTIDTYRLGSDASISSSTLSNGYECGHVVYSDYHHAIIDVYDGFHQVGYISIDKSGNLKTFYAEDYLPEGALLELFEPFGQTSSYLYFKYTDALDDSYYMMTDLGITDVISHYKATDFLYLDEDVFIRKSDQGYRFIQNGTEEYIYIPQSGSMTVRFDRVDDYVIINDIGTSDHTSFYNLDTKEIEFQLNGYYYGTYGDSQYKIIYLGNTYHIYDLSNSSDTDLGIYDTFMYVNERYFLLYNDDIIKIIDTDTSQIYEMERVATYTTDGTYSHNNYAFVGLYEGIYYILG